MSGLRVADCLSRDWLKVDAFQRYHDVDHGEAASPYGGFAVFDEGGFMGLVTSRQAALFPNRIFADLLIRRQPPPVPATATLEEVLPRFGGECCEHLAVVDEAGNFIGVISELSIFAALSEREAQILREREELIARLQKELEYHTMATMVFETTSEGVLVTDAKGHILYVNKAFTQTTGYTLEEAVGRTPALLHSGRHDKEFYRAMWQSLTDNGSWQGELWNRRKNGEVYPEWLHINAVRNAQGETTHYVGVFSDLGPNKEIQRELQHMAYYDPLTGLPNRRLFVDRLEQAVAQADRVKKGFSLLFIDLDRFKNINDAYGHELGDELLKIVARRIREAVRDSDTVARLGGDEFIVILHDCHDRGDCSIVAEKVRSAVNEPMLLGGHELIVSASIGISFYPEDGAAVSDIIRNADLAMYHAKQEGSGASFFRPEMSTDVAERLEMEVAMRRGLENGEFWLAWQPQVALDDGRFCGAEILARWKHNGEAIAPGQFIPVAEGSGLIEPLGDWVFRQAVREAVQFRQDCASCPLKVAVNFSPLQLKGADAFRKMMDVLREHGLPPAAMEVEVTESVLMGRRQGAMDFLKQAQEAGISVAVDDFGTGYSNLSNLKRVHVDVLKIDQSFVSDLEQNAVSRQIVQAIIGMAHSLELKVVAEGIETEGQYAILRELGFQP